jgi:hypothetical protein
MEQYRNGFYKVNKKIPPNPMIREGCNSPEEIFENKKKSLHDKKLKEGDNFES